jgi:hypothetical protein
MANSPGKLANSIWHKKGVWNLEPLSQMAAVAGKERGQSRVLMCVRQRSAMHIVTRSKGLMAYSLIARPAKAPSKTVRRETGGSRLGPVEENSPQRQMLQFPRS